MAVPAVTAASALALAAAPTAVTAQVPVRLGPEFRANTYTTDFQSGTAVAASDDGDFVVVWESDYQDGSMKGVYAQRYSADGTPQGEEFRANTYTRAHQARPSVAMDADGDFVIAWESGYNFGLTQEGRGYGVYAQRYSADGTPQGGEFHVNTTTTNNQCAPSVAMSADGDFVITWQSHAQDGSYYGVYARRYSANGTAQSGEFQVNTSIGGNQWNSSVAMHADGDFVVTWETEFGIDAQRYSADRTPQGGEFPVNLAAAAYQRKPSVAVGADGGFVVTWEFEGFEGQPGGLQRRVMVRRYGADGTAQGAAFLVGENDAHAPAVSISADGAFVVTFGCLDAQWGGICARRFNAAGVAQGAEVAVNTYATSEQQNPSVASSGNGDFVIAWHSNHPMDEGLSNIAVQRFQGVNRPVVVGGQLAGQLVGVEGWRLLAAASPATTVGDLLGPVWTQGFPGADYAGGQPNVYRYDETATGGLGAGYTAPASATEPMGSGRGYFTYVYADDDPGTPGVQGGFPKALTVAGAAPVGPVALPVTYTATADGATVDGWNLVGNPYRESIDWDLAVRSDVATTAYVYDPAGPAYRVWNGVAGDLPGGVVTALQGFWVKAMDTDASGTVAPSVQLPVSAQVSGAGTFYGRPGFGSTEAAPVLALNLLREAGGYGREAAASVSLEAGATAGLDAADAYALDPMAYDYTALFTRAADGTALAIQALPEGGAYTVGLEVVAVEAGQPAGGRFTLSWAAPAFPAGTTARLVDRETGASVDLTTAGTYSFSLDASEGRMETPATTDAGPPAPRVLGGEGQRLSGDRFTVVVNGAVTGTEAPASALTLTVAPNPIAGSGVVRYLLPEAARVRVSVYDVLGREVAVLQDGEQGAGRYDVALDAGALAPGAYVVRLTAGEAQVVRRVTVGR